MRAATMVRLTVLTKVVCFVTGIAGCAQQIGGPGPMVLSQPWMLGIERMRDDPAPQLPFTNRLIDDLSAMPRPAPPRPSAYGLRSCQSRPRHRSVSGRTLTVACSKWG